MTAFMVGVGGCVGLLVLIVLKMPIGIALIVVGVVGFALQLGWGPALSLLIGDPTGYLTSMDLATIPLFLLLGTFASAAGFSRDLYNIATAFLGHRKGGLASATLLGSAAFGSVCGSTTATAVTFTKIALPEMLRRNYDPGFAAASIAGGGALKALIPPSLVMILYSIITNVFIFDVFMAAVTPAILCVMLNLVATYLVARFRPEWVPIATKVDWAERGAALRRALPAFILMLAIFGGLYSGLFTVNEAAAVAAVLALILTVLRGRLTGPIFYHALVEAAGIVTMIYILIFGAGIFGYFISLARVPEALIAVVTSIQLPPFAIVSSIVAAYILIGAVFDEIAAMLITVPFVLPIIVHLGYDPVWWGIMNVVIIELGMIVPPIGIIVFIIHGMRPTIPLSAIYRGVVPFILADVALLVILMLLPELSTWPLKWFTG